MPYYIACRQLVQVKNPYLDAMEEDILYHFSLGTKTHNLPEMFGDLKVCEMIKKIKLNDFGFGGFQKREHRNHSSPFSASRSLSVLEAARIE